MNLFAAYLQKSRTLLIIVMLTIVENKKDYSGDEKIINPSSV